MSRSYQRANSHIPKTAVITLIALVLFMSVSALVSHSAPNAHAQTATFPLNSPVAATANINLRDQPANTGAVVIAMPVNSRATVIGGPFNGAWYWLDYKGTRGYTTNQGLALVDDKYTPVPAQSSTPAGTPPPQASGTPQPSVPPTSTITNTLPIPVPSTPGDYTGLWLGEMSQAGNVRSGPGVDKPVVKGWWKGRRVLLYEAAADSKGGIWYRVSEPPEVPQWVHSSLIVKVAPVKFESARFTGRWVNVNLTQQIVTAYEDGKPVKVTLASTGKAKHATNVGTWKIYWRLPKQTMEGGNLASGDYYKLKDVPYPQYFHVSGEALHGTFWHDNFGRPMSHGCVNLSTPIAGWLYNWASIGTIVYVHY